MKVTIRYPTSWGQQKTEMVEFDSEVISMEEFQNTVQRVTLIRRSDQIIKFMRYGKLIKLAEMRQQVDFQEIFENESPIFQIYTKNVSDMNKRYYKKLQRIQLSKQRQSSIGDDSSSYSRSRSNNIFQLQRMHDSNLDLGDAQDQQGGGIYQDNNNTATTGGGGGATTTGQANNQSRNYQQRNNSRSRDYDLFRQNSLSEGPFSTNESHIKDCMESYSSKNDIISQYRQTSLNSTTERNSSLVEPQGILNKLKALEKQESNFATSDSSKNNNDESDNIARHNHSYSLKKGKEVLNLLQESFLQGIPEKPAFIRGRVHRQLFSFVMGEKYLEINPEICSLIFYEHEKDIPKKPGDIYPIKDIDSISEFEPTFFMKKNYYYIKISYVHDIIIGFRYKSTQSLWLTHLHRAMEYCKYVEKKIEYYVYQHNYKKLERSILLTSMIENEEQILTLDDKQRASDQGKQPSKQVKKSAVLEPITQNSQNLEKSSHKNHKETTTTAASEKLNTLKATNIFKLDHIEESKNEDRVSNKSKYSYIKPSHLEESEKIKLSSFDIFDIIGSGAFGRVFLAQKKSNKQMFVALKSLKKRQLLNKNYLKYAQTELNILKKCRSPFIIGLNSSFQTQNYIFMALDYCSGGDLGLILTQKNGMKEKTIKFIIAQVVLAIEYLHNISVVYRDLKPENILLDSEGYIKLADFGLSRENVKEDEICKSFCGSPAYISPEQLLKIGATKKTDIYGIGCIMYEMYCGNPPFYDQDIQTLFENIKNKPIEFNENFSPVCKDLLEKMLHKEYEKRPTIAEVKQHPYFKKMDWNQLYHRKLPVPDEILECIDIHGAVQNNYNYQNAQIFKDAEYDLTQPNQKNKIDNWSFVQHYYEYV